MRPIVAPPQDDVELLERCRQLAGRTIAEVAERGRVPVPPNLKRHKGFVGNLLERVLGATAASRAEPDFPHLGIEMKTLPVTAQGRVLQSTYVCTAPLDGSMAPTWEASWVCHKLAKVLWMPVVGGPEVPVAERVVGSALLWVPSVEERADLQRDWELLAEIIARGEHGNLDARHGEWLQIRPKGSSSLDLVWALSEEGEWVRDQARGFYLRPRFTRRVLSANYLI